MTLSVYSSFHCSKIHVSTRKRAEQGRNNKIWSYENGTKNVSLTNEDITIMLDSILMAVIAAYLVHFCMDSCVFLPLEVFREIQLDPFSEANERVFKCEEPDHEYFVGLHAIVKNSGEERFGCAVCIVVFYLCV
jgi:hypothetical protein